jgi:hypothetical protein
LGRLQKSEKEEERVWRFEEPDTDGEGGVGNKKNGKDRRRPWQDRQNGTELDLDAISERLRTGSDRIIERMKGASENEDFGVIKVGGASSVS